MTANLTRIQSAHFLFSFNLYTDFHFNLTNNMTELQANFLKIEHETEDEFKGIAQKLFDNYAIQNHDSIFRIIEIEFYWTSPNHKDDSTYQRKHVNPRQGEWFFHYSGVDIALMNEETGGFGGILIRSIYDIEAKKIYKGPMVCSMKLFSGTDAFTESLKTKIIEGEFKKSTIKKNMRVGLGDNAKRSGSEKLNYNYSIDPNDN